MSDDHFDRESDPDRDEPGALLNALLDGELDARESAWVDAYLAESAAARAELEALRAVRSSVRSLPAVEPPAGFIEDLLRAGALDQPAVDAPPAMQEVLGATTDGLRAVPSPTAAPVPVSEPSPFAAAGASGGTHRVGRGRSRPGPSFSRVAAAVGAAAAAVVVLLGITPVTDAIAPPVHAYAARHDQMMAAPPLPGADPTSTTSTAPPTTEVDVPGATALPATSSTTMPGVAEAQAMRFAPMAPAALDAMDAPFVAPPSMGNGTLSRMAAYHSTAETDTGAGPGGVLHLMYTDGSAVISVYEQAGAVEWEALPAGTSMTIGGDPAWAMRRGSDEVVVVARGTMVYTIVATAPHEMTMDMADELPRAADASVPERAQAACRTMVVRFGFGD